MMFQFAFVTLLSLGLQAGRPPVFFTTPYSIDEMRGKQAVIETSMGTAVIALLPDSAPNHFGLSMELARVGAYTGAIFHRVLRYGIVQGGDPVSKDPAKSTLYGTGGLNQLRFETNSDNHTAGAVSAALAG